jgi:hypothetical protein
VRLLLDEHFSPEIAESLRPHGHDVVAVAEREDLRGRADAVILAAAAAERRVVVTEDVGDLMSLAARRLPDRKPHRGVVLVARHAFPRYRSGFGAIIRALDALLAAHPGDDDLVGNVIWLAGVPADRT